MAFANGFVGAYKDPGRAAFRRTGLAEGPDGALHVSDDVHGRIWRITYNGDGTDKVAPAQAPTVATTAPGLAMPPEGTHPEAGRSTPPLPTSPGVHCGSGGARRPDLSWRGQRRHVQRMSRVRRRRQHHRATPQFRPLAESDGSLPGPTATIENGVAHPKQYQGVMPPLGGAPLSPRDVAAVAAYVWAVGHTGKP